MKALFTSLVMIFSLGTLMAQVDVPLNETNGHVEYTEVVAVDGLAADKLYKRVEHWFNTYYKNPGSVIETADPAKGISGKHFIMVYNTVNGKQNLYGKVRYFVDVFVRDGRYKYTINDVYLYQTPKIYVEEWLDESAANKDVNLGYLSQVDEFIQATIADLKKTLANPLPEEAADDW